MRVAKRWNEWTEEQIVVEKKKKRFQQTAATPVSHLRENQNEKYPTNEGKKCI